MNILDRYLDRVLLYANQPEAQATTVRRELHDHLLQKIDDLAAGGLSREEATLEAVRQHGSPRTVGYGLRGAFPWIDIRAHGTARGVIAVGPRAVGIFAFGGFAVGVVACGGSAIGLISAGGLAFGLLFVWAGVGIGAVSCAGLALGLIATGGLAVGVLALGGQAIGAWVPTTWGHANIVSHYTAATVPHWLRAFEPVLYACAKFDQYAIPITLPFYLLFVFGLSYLQIREANRVAAKDDWLIDG